MYMSLKFLIFMGPFAGTVVITHSRKTEQRNIDARSCGLNGVPGREFRRTSAIERHNAVFAACQTVNSRGA
jgi:hypothetical protein